MRYRPEINGLRAIAVMSVVVYHAFPNILPGGFAGVDVFFVISGYLITSLILVDLESGSFSFSRFYERRFRRLLPAFAFVVLCAIPISLFGMLDHDLSNFGKSIVASIFFASNIYFSTAVDYFSPNSESLLLLHTWSLSLEEQFYLFFPFLLVFLYNYSKRFLGAVIFLLALFSFGSLYFPLGIEQKFKFYLLPFRAWELLLGSLIAVGLFERVLCKIGTRWKDIGCLFGLVCIIASIFVLNKNTPYPSYVTLLPVFGTFFVIIFAEQGSFVYKILTYKPLSLVGLISYSFYLWHHLVFSSARIFSLGNPSVFLLSICLVSSFCLAYLTWLFVEEPLRNIKADRRSVFSTSLLGMFVLALIGFSLHFKSGAIVESVHDINSTDFNPEKRFVQCVSSISIVAQPVLSEGSMVGCIFQTAQIKGELVRDVVLWGDSHAAALGTNFLNDAVQHGYRLHYFANLGCPPLPGFVRPDRACFEKNDFILSYLSSIESGDIYLVSRWRAFINRSAFFNTFQNVKDVSYVRETDFYLNLNSVESDSHFHTKNVENSLSIVLSKLSKLNVVVVDQPPEFGFDVPKIGLVKGLDSAKVLKDDFLVDYRSVDRIFVNLSQKFPFVRVSLADAFCDEKFCYGYEGDKALFFDSNHLSVHGADRISGLLFGSRSN
ncbi:peptidoglycan/LPS O-acetylase OafA/YrhL [Limnobacter thiooxidans]|uniref:acyltransferase family protein n=1 Tax=Limnobacter thiooxidans TaxID=131080 RepID=UPI00102DD8F0|nr:peptidoglycan/LPS O-acetylase OafA/YrhL [Limnobacter thiooxidans]